MILYCLLVSVSVGCIILISYVTPLVQGTRSIGILHGPANSGDRIGNNPPLETPDWSQVIVNMKGLAGGIPYGGTDLIWSLREEMP